MKFAVKVHNEFLSRAIQELAFSNGYKWKNDTDAKIDSQPYNWEIGFNIDDEFELTNSITGYSDSMYEPMPLFDAKTDWDKIEQAMKPKEPRAIWVNEYTNSLGGVFLSESGARDYENRTGYIRTIKFQEVI